MRIEDRLQGELAALQQLERKRELRLPAGIDFTSNDYLGLTQSQALRERIIEKLAEGMPLGAGGSRLLRGNHHWHEEAEQAFAEFEGVEHALFFSSGYHANMAVLTALPTRHDVILYDTMVHASIKEGIRASLAAKKSFEHNSLSSLREMARAARKEGSDIYVVVESLYSMDGDEVPLQELAALCDELDLALIVDEAHATGLFGKDGRGLIDDYGVRDNVLVSTHPCGKAIAAAGSFVCASEVIISYLINKARTMIFTTALPPIVAATIIEVLKGFKEDAQLREQLLTNAAFFRQRLQRSLQQWRVSDGRSPIVPLIVGEDPVACAVSDALLERGFDIRPIRPPTVAEGTARFRITINALHTREQLEELCEALIALEQEYR